MKPIRRLDANAVARSRPAGEHAANSTVAKVASILRASDHDQSRNAFFFRAVKGKDRQNDP